jgi:hypothetical protein
MFEYKAKCGDFFLCDSDKFGPRIVKFLQQAPTLWHWIYRQIKHTQQPVRFYHAGMIISDDQLVEQQWKVQYDDAHKILSRKVIIYRMKYLSEDERWIFKGRAAEDIGKIYDIPQLIGKTLTWLTGVKVFVDVLGAASKEEEICVTRIGDWYEGFCDFGVKNRSELTTKILDNYCSNHPEEWQVIYYNSGV